MPIVLSKDRLSELGAPKALPPPAARAPASVDVAVTDGRVADALVAALTAITATQADQAAGLAKMSDHITKNSGQWLATVKSRDQRGRILSLELTHKQ